MDPVTFAREKMRLIRLIPRVWMGGPVTQRMKQVRTILSHMTVTPEELPFFEMEIMLARAAQEKQQNFLANRSTDFLSTDGEPATAGH